MVARNQFEADDVGSGDLVRHARISLVLKEPKNVSQPDVTSREAAKGRQLINRIFPEEPANDVEGT